MVVGGWLVGCWVGLLVVGWLVVCGWVGVGVVVVGWLVGLL